MQFGLGENGGLDFLIFKRLRKGKRQDQTFLFFLSYVQVDFLWTCSCFTPSKYAILYVSLCQFIFYGSDYILCYQTRSVMCQCFFLCNVLYIHLIYIRDLKGLYSSLFFSFFSTARVRFFFYDKKSFFFVLYTVTN